MAATDSILIQELEVWYRVGVPEEEREKLQRLTLSIEITHDFTPATETDDLTQTIDYFAVTQRLLQFGAGRTWKLIETLAAEIAETILCEFGGRQIQVEVRKFIIPQARYVAVRVERARRVKKLKRGEASVSDSEGKLDLQGG